MRSIKPLLILILGLVLMGADRDASTPIAKIDTIDQDFTWSSINRHNPERDDPDEVIFSEDFEEGAEGWTTLDFTVTDTAWHKSDFNQREEDDLLWWCGDTLLQYDDDPVGYDNSWLQWLDTPPLNLSEAGDELTLTFDAWWLLEDPRIVPPPDPYDGWDGWLVMISTDGGEEFAPIEPVGPAYTAERLSAAERFWEVEAEIPGWVFVSTSEEWPDSNRAERPDPEWLECEFDLSEYRNEEVIVRFILFSDRAVAAPFGNVYLQESGVCIDNILISDGEEPFLANNADDDPIPENGELIAGCFNEASGIPWEFTDEDGHESENSAHCPIEENLECGLISPPIEIQGEGWYTYFDFWVICNTQMADSDGDGALDDLFDVQISTDQRSWTRIIYDYGAEDHDEFYENWGHYQPGTWFRTDLEEWRIMLNLTAWAGETVYLCWRMITDDVMDDPQGSGLWLDDIRVISTEAREHDVGIEWLHLNYPNTIGLRADGQIVVKNYGMVTQNNVRKYFRLGEEGRVTPITPWQGDLEGDSSRAYNFRVSAQDYADEFALFTWTDLVDDENPENDMAVLDFVIYPEEMYKLGYDNRYADDFVRFAIDNGPAVLFTPSDDGVDGRFDLQWIDVQWDDQQVNEEVYTTLRIFADNRGDLGQQLFTDEILVESEQQRIDLSEIETLKNIDTDFWIYFNVNRDDLLPVFTGRTVVGDDPNWGEGHYYVSNGGAVEERPFELLIQALTTSAGAPEVELTPGSETVDFGLVEPDSIAEISLMVFGSGTTPVTIESIEISNDALFDYVSVEELPIELGIGEYAQFLLYFVPRVEEYWTAWMTFQCSDDYEFSVRLRGRSTEDVNFEDESLPLRFELAKPYPNPFNSVTTLNYSLDVAGDVKLGVYDLSGRMLITLADCWQPEGRYTIPFNGDNLPSGVYLIKLQSGTKTTARKVMLMR